MSIPTAGDDNYSIDLEGRSGLPKTIIGNYSYSLIREVAAQLSLKLLNPLKYVPLAKLKRNVSA